MCSPQMQSDWNDDNFFFNYFELKADQISDAINVWWFFFSNAKWQQFNRIWKCAIRKCWNESFKCNFSSKKKKKNNLRTKDAIKKNLRIINYDVLHRAKMTNVSNHLWFAVVPLQSVLLNRNIRLSNADNYLFYSFILLTIVRSVFRADHKLNSNHHNNNHSNRLISVDNIMRSVNIKPCMKES